MSLAAHRLYTPEEYLAFERAAEDKNEYINGCIVAMSGASRRHNLVTVNAAGELRQQLRERPCEVYSSDMRVQINAAGQYRYPDVIVVCGEPQFEDAELDTLLNPTVIVEVLSPSTEAVDRGDKFAAYRRLPSLQEYVLIAQDKPCVEHFLRQGERWLLTEFSGLNDIVPLPAIDCTLALRELYRKVPVASGGDRPGREGP